VPEGDESGLGVLGWKGGQEILREKGKSNTWFRGKKGE